jgi:hypothetical protein
MFAKLLQSFVKVLQAVVGATVQYTELKLSNRASDWGMKIQITNE